MVTISVGKVYGLERILCYRHWLPMGQAEDSVSLCYQVALGIWRRGSVHNSGTMILVRFLHFCAACYDINAVLTHTW